MALALARVRSMKDEQEKIRREEEEARRQTLERPTDEPTLLWRVPANAVSLATGAATASIKAGVTAARWGLSASRQATYGIIGLNQTILEGILKAAGQDILSSSQVEYRNQVALRHVETWTASFHAALAGASVLAASGFFVAESALNWTSDSTLLTLHFLNSIFGSTDASRAVAALVQLMKKELEKPGADGSTDPIPTYELLTTLASFLFLQRSGRRKTELEWRNAGGDFTIWDIVIDDKGFRADVIGTRRPGVITSSNVVKSPALEEPAEDFSVIAAQVDNDFTTTHVALTSEDQTRLSDLEIRQRILDQLPRGTKATITSETLTMKTIRVDIHASGSMNIEPPPGMVLVSEHPNFDNSAGMQTVIFRTASKAVAKADVTPESQHPFLPVEPDDQHDHDEGGMMMSPSPRRPVLGAPLPQTEERRQSSSTAYEPQAADSSSIQAVAPGPVANQKKVRKAVPDLTSSPPPPPPRQTKISQTGLRRERNADVQKTDKPEKPGMIKKALKSLSPTQSTTTLNRIIPSSSRNRSTSGSGNALSETLKPLTTTRNAPRKSIFQMPTTQPTTPIMSPLRTTPGHEGGRDYFSIHEQKREATYSQTDTYSLHSNDSKPPSPTMSRTHLRASSSISKTRSSTEISAQPQQVDHHPDQSGLHHRRSHSFVPSLYSMGTKDEGEDTLVLAPKTPVPKKSIFESHEMLLALSRNGMVPGQFPKRHIIWALRRFGRFASAVYGKDFLMLTRMAQNMRPSDLNNVQALVPSDVHHEHTSFAVYTGLPNETIIKSSFVNNEGAVSKAKESGFSPIVHFVTIDLEAKAIVLTLRGTLGFEDLLTDMACDYAEIYWQGRAYKAHRGIRDSARRMMDSKGGNYVMAVLKAALEEYPEFGLVFVGHSLGGAVAAVLAIMLAEPSKHEPGEMDAPAFVTAARPKLIPSTAHAASSRDIPPLSIPSGRPIHVYAFGTPACISPDLRIATRGLITTVINANDIVPNLSLGTLHDFRAVARRLKQDFNGKVNNIRARASERIYNNFWHFWNRSADSEAAASPPPPHNLAGDALGEDTWMWNELVEMRKLMDNEKLVPPGEVFTLESTRVFDRDPDETTSSGIEGSRTMNPLGRAATRIQLKYVRDVETRFKEVRFTRTMFKEHAPWTYEDRLSALERGVYDEA